MRRISIVLLVLFACLVAAPMRLAAQQHTHGKCSVATLKGTFGTFEQGTVVADIGFGPPPFPAVVAGTITYDGAGNFTSTFSANFNGIPFTSAATGTYLVNPDCTYSDSVPSTDSNGAGIITGEGTEQEVHFVYTGGSVLAAGTLKKIRPFACSEHSVKGRFGLFGEGTFAPAGTPLLANHVGIVTFDGFGHFYGQETVNVGGAPTTQTNFTGTYTVTSDCTVTAEIVSPVMPPIHEAGVITGAGMNLEIHNIVMDPGWTFADTLTPQ